MCFMRKCFKEENLFVNEIGLKTKRQCIKYDTTELKVFLASLWFRINIIVIKCIESGSPHSQNVYVYIWEATKTIQRETQQRWEELKQFRRQLRTKSSMRKQQTLSQSTCHFNLNMFQLFYNINFYIRLAHTNTKYRRTQAQVAIYKRRLIV